ncbi:hypothetical protein [Pseudoalteromonas umbrosa]|uniref:hypothetical protein n=1 Tax=Pseudoalteromonas umbrosa TaxID=3048489 RepID=UPI0024C2EF2C|nr:hypothetical protein [Pseudoalteromonas sp. B95]MDK1290069.1 hypothetical protein [Pseudoalteromonas sp. B95]
MAYYSPQLVSEMMMRCMTGFNDGFFPYTGLFYHHNTGNNRTWGDDTVTGGHRSLTYTNARIDRDFKGNIGHVFQYVGTAMLRPFEEYNKFFDAAELPDVTTLREGMGPIICRNNRVEFTISGTFSTYILKWLKDQGTTYPSFAGYLHMMHLNGSSFHEWPLMRYTFQVKERSLADIPENWVGHPYPDFKLEYDETAPDAATEVASITMDITQVACVSERFESDVETWAALPMRSETAY